MNSEITPYIVSNAFFNTWRTETIGDKSYLVVKGVPLKEGVLNSRYVSSDEFGAFVKDWNGIPIVMRHPKQNGGSARVVTPDVPVVGRFYNSEMDGTRLVGEYWLEEAALDNPDGEVVVMRIKAQLPVETSTGYYAESVPSVGKWNGKDYGLIDRNIHPDHIALLPDEIGACSLDDGCGMNRNQQMSNFDIHKRTKQNNIEGSFEQRSGAVYDAFYAAFSGGSNKAVESDAPYVMSTFADHIVVKADGKYFQVGYSVAGDEVTFDDRSKWQEVMRMEKYIPVQNVTGLTGDAAKMWEKVYTAALKQYDDDKEKAAATAWAAIKDKYKKNKSGEWVLKENAQPKQNAHLDISPEELEGLAALAAFVAD